MATVVKTQRPEDFLALVPQLAGFRPRNSIIIVAFRGNRTCAAMRFNVPDADAGAGYSTVAGRLIGILCKVRGADAVVPVVYTDDRFADCRGIPHAGFVRAVVDRARTAGFLVRDALCVAEDGWGSYLDQDCPRDGRPLAAIESSSVNGAIPRELRNDLGPVDAGSELPTVDLATRERVARLVKGLHEYVRAQRDPDVADVADPAMVDPGLIEPELFEPEAIAREPDDDGWDDDGWEDGDNEQDDLFDDDAYGDDSDGAYGDESYDDAGDADDDMPRSGWLPGFAEDALQLPPDAIDDRAAAVLILCLQSPMMRDVVMLQWAFGLEVGELALDENKRFLAGEDPAAFLVAPLMWGDGPRPDVPRVRAAIVLVKALAARAPRSMRPPLLCQLAWFNWALGKSSLAGRFVGEAERIDANFGLAELLRAMLEAGHLPEWAFAIPDDAGTR
ncbi:hypothetical protein ABIB15_002696 [Marisediminicola sp. UYEF4]|uniref:DUF4192 family protein n=1 Tax=Marisediminicola sp. UYEF4 TaxID=1756384 RepID=UPI00339345FE